MRSKMSREDRAKQFMPYAALKGYEETLRAKKKIVVPKVELSEDIKEVLDRKLQQIERNDIIKVVYFQRDEYLEVTGMVSRIDITAKVLKVVNTKISFEDIFDVRGAKLRE